GNLLVKLHQVLRGSKLGRSGFPYKVSAPFSPTALGRWKIQFCQAERRLKILLSHPSEPGKRRLASMPVSASGERLSRSSHATPGPRPVPRPHHGGGRPRG